MPLLELPHSKDCLVCGRENPHGVHLSLFVDDSSGEVRTKFVPQPHHTGFENVVHGGILATVVDEAMVWAATWRGRRFCLCAELTTRFRHPSRVGRSMDVIAWVEFSRPRLIETTAKFVDPETNVLLATASGKYIPVDADQHLTFLETFVNEPSTADAVAFLRK